MVAALGRLAMGAIRRPASAALPALPTPWIEACVAPPPAALVRDYVRHVGGDPAWYRGTIPAHLFPQWGLPLAAWNRCFFPPKEWVSGH